MNLRTLIMTALLVLGACASANAQYVYVTDTNSGGVDGIRVFSLDRSTGLLTLVTATATGSAPNSVAIHPTGRFLFTTNENASSVSGFSVDPVSGTLTAIPGSPFTTGTGPNCARFDPSGRFLYVPSENDIMLSIFAVDPSTGVPTPVTGTPISLQPAAAARTDFIAFTPTGAFAYVTDDGAPGQVLAFQVDPVSGTVTAAPGSPVATEDAPDAVAVDPSGRFAYVANFSGNSVSAFTITATGGLAPIAGSPFSLTGTPDAIAVLPSGKFLYTADDASSSFPGIFGFSIDQTTGALVTITGSPFPAGSATSTLTPDPSGRFLFVSDEGSDLFVFSVNPTTGALTAVTHTAAGGEPGPIAVTPTLVSATGQSIAATATAAIASAPVATVTDNDRTLTAAEMTATISWGDGASSAGTVTGTAGGPFTVTGSHTYAAAGSFPLVVQVTDTRSNVTASTTGQSRVATVAAAPVVAGVVFPSGHHGGSCTAGPAGGSGTPAIPYATLLGLLLAARGLTRRSRG